MLASFNEEAQYILLKSKTEMLNLNHPYIGSEHFVLSILKVENKLTEKLSEYGLTYDTFKTEILNIIGKGTKKTTFFLYTPLLKKIIENSMLDAKDNNNGVVTPEHLFSALLEEGEGIAIRLFIGMNINIDELYNEFSQKFIATPRKRKKKLLITELGTDLVEKAKKSKLDPVIGREKEINRLIEILCRRCKNNPILIGEAGVGKTAIVEQLSNLIATSNVPPVLENKKIISIDMATLVSGTKYRGEFEERMQKVIKEVEEDENIILFIDEIHTLVGAGGAEGAIDASNILKPALARGKIKCIGATTTEEYKKQIEPDKALSRRFQPIRIEEPNELETINILTKVKSIYEKYHNVEISNSIVKKLVHLSNKYIYTRHNPDKSLDILDEVCSKVSLQENPQDKEIRKLKHEISDITKNKNSLILDNNLEKAYLFRKEEANLTSKLNKLEITYKKDINKVTEEDIASVIHEKTNIPIYEILKDSEKTIKNIEKSLKNSIIGQDKAIDSLISYTKKIKLGYTENKIKSFLFVGPTGVGKTALAKMYSNLTQGENKLIRLDMSEYSNETAINKIIGSAPGYVGYQDKNNILEIIKENPTAVILMDEIDKASPSVINLLYQMLDESTIKDSQNNEVKLNNNTIIMTSNIGFEEKTLGFTNNQNINNIEFSKLQEKLPVALINRIDNIIIFNNLTKNDITKIIKNKLEHLKQKYSEFKYSNSLIDEIVELSNYKEYGARKINKIIETKLENLIIDRIISNVSLEIYNLPQTVTT